MEKIHSNAEGAGHGGMDYVFQAFVESVKRRTRTPIDTYDAAAWSAITPLVNKVLRWVIKRMTARISVAEDGCRRRIFLR